MSDRPNFQAAAEAFLTLPRDADQVARRFESAYNAGRRDQQTDDQPAWAELRARVRELEAERLKLAKHVARAASVHPERVHDHACAECIPDGEIIISGFRCAVHLALSVVASPNDPEGKTKS